MAGTSPTRRSSRARTNTLTQSQLSSAASSLSGRTERSIRALPKAGSPQKSTGSGSLSSEPPEDSAATTTTADDNPLTRRRSARGKEDDRDRPPKAELSDMAIVSDDNDIQEDDEAVRCVCGFDDYPGLPPLDEDTKSNATKDSIDLDPLFSIEVTDDLAGFFVQCDICKVWEHGLCMGIINEDLLPDDYYCEICRKDLHKIYTASNGQKYSVYLPLHRPSRATSRATSAPKDGTRSPKSGERKSSRVSASSQSSFNKRRSTMNSRDAAYDEEQLRRAIELSREEVIPEEPELGSRRPKRGRDDDEEKLDIKRQRTTSMSPSPFKDQAPLASPEDSEDDDDDDDSGRSGQAKRSRNAARNQREKAERDERREEQERKRAEAASKRKGRAERRRADESDPSDETPLANRTPATRSIESVQPPDPPTSSQPVPDTPPASAVLNNPSRKKTVLPKKKGRNQYTKDRDNDEGSPARSVSRDVTRNHDEHGTSHSRANLEGGSKQNSRSKGGMSSKITMTDLKRRANNILEYITRTQVELANDPLSEKNSPRQSANETGTDDVPSIQANGEDLKPTKDSTSGINGASKASLLSSSKNFKDLSCIEMMDSLTRELVKWQQEFTP